MGDFGLAVQLEHSFSERSIICGTLVYMAPEVFEERSCLKSDVWSLGVSIIELAEGRNPYMSIPASEIKRTVVETPSPSLSSRWSAQFVDFVNRCLIKDAEKRPSIANLMNVLIEYSIQK